MVDVGRSMVLPMCPVPWRLGVEVSTYVFDRSSQKNFLPSLGEQVC